ncbi:hypothetical protein D3C76_1639490 [compost metagenome]
MAGAQHNAVFLHQINIARHIVNRVHMHGSPDVVALQPQNKLEDFGIRFRPHSVGVLKHLGCPAAELLLIIEENPAVLHIRHVSD